MYERVYLLEVFVAMAAATFACRLFPFLMPRRHTDNRHLRRIEDSLPAAVMLLLVAYCLRGVNIGAPPYGIPELLAVAVVVSVHLWRRNSLLSIATGTGLHVFLVRSRIIEQLLAR